MRAITRRVLLRDLLTAGGGLLVISRATPSPLPVAPNDPWAVVPELLRGIVPPVFPRRDFVITEFGARPDGRADATAAIAGAVDACHRAGGGRVVVPGGEYLTGPIHLRSGVDLHVDAGATLRFSRDPAGYPVVFTRWEGVELMNYSPLVYAFDCQNVAVTGEGTLDGQAGSRQWWPWKNRASSDRDRLMQQAEDGVPVAQRVYGTGHFLRPAFIEPYRCHGVLIEGVTIRNAPFWALHPTLCTNVTVRGVKVISQGPNNDGCDPESCRGVLIEDCLFYTGDDCIALKSGRNADGRRLSVPVEDVVIRRCRMKSGHGGIAIGSEISGGARNIYAEQCVLDSPDLERGLRVKTNTMRGGIIENIDLRDIDIGSVQLAPIEIDLRYDAERETGRFMPVVRNVLIERMRSARSRYGLRIRGLEQAPIQNVVVRDCTFRGVADGHVIEGVVDLQLSGVTVEAASSER